MKLLTKFNGYRFDSYCVTSVTHGVMVACFLSCLVKHSFFNITNVCLVDGNKLARNGVHSFLSLKFDDVEKDSPTETAISKSDAEAIVKYINRVKNKVDYIAVNCEAGVSRSAGVCAAIMMALNGDDSEVFNDPSKCPNMKCYRTVLNEFAENGYFDEDTKGISNEEIHQKELDNIEIWKGNLE